jgi:hypothetical protein
MTPRRRRIERILDHRKKELDDVIAVLSAVKAREASAVAEADAADARLTEATNARRELAAKGSGVTEFIEAEEWLYSTTKRRDRAWSAVTAARREVAKVQLAVAEARTKLKQAEQLATRVELSEKKLADRRERRRDDEAAARIAQRNAAMAGPK